MRHVVNFKPGPFSRKCGDCDLCCTYLPIAELDLLAGEPCEHLKGSGCAIYSERPDVCRSYGCLWLFGLGSVHQRPDRMGAVPTMTDNGRYHALYLRPGMTPDDLPRELRDWVKREHRKKKPNGPQPVVLLWGDDYHVSTILRPDGTREDRETDWVGPLAQIIDKRRKSAGEET